MTTNSNQQLLNVETEFHEENDGRFKAVGMELFNWGTFSDYHNIPMSEEGHLFCGPSGSGKSTILDAHATLMTPTKWLSFNAAAREAGKKGQDRNLIAYVRGAWGEQTGEGGEATMQFLRPGPTWSAISETYRNGRGEHVVLVRIFWVPNKSKSNSDLHVLFMVMRHPFSILELKTFPATGFDVKKLKQSFPNEFIRDEFTPYMERFTSLLGIANVLALRLLHKTQSEKSLGDINLFFRDYMLERPGTFETADRLVTQFGELDKAHMAVVTAKKQIEVLAPARENLKKLNTESSSLLELREIEVGVEPFRAKKSNQTLVAKLSELRTQGSALHQVVEQQSKKERNAQGEVTRLHQLLEGNGGNAIRSIEQQIDAEKQTRLERERRRDKVRAACAAIERPLPEGAHGYEAFAAYCDEATAQSITESNARADRHAELKMAMKETDKKFKEFYEEAESLRRQNSNMPRKLLALRDVMAQEIGIDPSRLLFGGEVLQVKPSEKEWHGAIERAMRGFSLRLLVEDGLIGKVSKYINNRHIGMRLTFLRMVPHSGAGNRIDADSMIHKIEIAKKSCAQWVRDHLAENYDYACMREVEGFNKAKKAITPEGLVKHGYKNYEKDDRFRVNDPDNWVMGFDNTEKRKRIEGLAIDAAAELEKAKKEVEKVVLESSDAEKLKSHYLVVVGYTWNDIDVGNSLNRLNQLSKELLAARAARPDLAEMEDKIRSAEDALEKAITELNEAKADASINVKEIYQTEKEIASLPEALLQVQLTPLQQEELAARFEKISRGIGARTVDNIMFNVGQELSKEIAASKDAISELKSEVILAFKSFIDTWKIDAEGLDCNLESAPDFMAKLERLEVDGLPKYEKRFFKLMEDQSDQNLAMLKSQLERERLDIHNKLDMVNASLAGTEFNPGTTLLISTADLSIADVREFRTTLDAALDRHLNTDQTDHEKRFAVLNTLVKRLSSQEHVDQKWKATVLDVRYHVEFVAKELDANSIEKEIFRGGGGKSGGQKQKLACTCLAAALRYQLVGDGMNLPTYSTVVIDEAFDKSDANFMTTIMDVFETFGFQVITATPMKTVMAMEPYIGGAYMVDCKDKKKSSLLSIQYNQETRRLKFRKDQESMIQEAVAEAA